MSPIGFILIAIIIAMPVAWLASEFQEKRWLRIATGILAIAVISTCISGVCSLGMRFDYNSWYGSATHDLIRTSLLQIEDGHLERVLKVWRGLDEQYHPTYENRANYNELVEEATQRMRGDVPIEAGSPWDAAPFRAETWAGHWEEDSGFWIVIGNAETPLDIERSGNPRVKMRSVSISPDFTVLKFKEGDQWLHTLTLNNKYKASHEWLDLRTGAVWETRPIYKLIRASEEQKKMTQQ